MLPPGERGTTDPAVQTGFGLGPEPHQDLQGQPAPGAGFGAELHLRGHQVLRGLRNLKL